jgi:mercuric ion transport protein
MQIWRYLFAAAAVLYLAGVVVQVYLAGLGLFSGAGFEGHIDLGYTLSLAPVIPLLLAWPARAGQRTMLLCAALLVAAFVQSILPLLRDAVPWIAALHPLNAIVVFGLSGITARRAVALARASERIPKDQPATARG